MRRVVITGMGALTPIGNDWGEVSASLGAGTTGIRHMQEWERYEGLNTLLGAPVREFELPEHYTRKRTRSMGRVSLLAVRASEISLQDAGLSKDAVLKSGRTGISYGSSAGSTDAIGEFANMLMNHSMDGINATTYVRFMNHTAAVNIGVFFGLKGRVIPTSSACTSGSQGIGFAFEAIRQGSQDVMLAGGGEELSVADAAVFDVLFATSTRNDEPGQTPRPFDRDRDGLVVGEGACTLILEERERALARGAHIYAEIAGYGTNSDGQHVTQPSHSTMKRAMELALEDAGLQPGDIDYINAHGTATQRGDIAEARATHELFGGNTPVSSMKGHTGHTLGACGAIEAWMGIRMMMDGQFAPTANLKNPDPECAPLDFIRDQPREIEASRVMNNNFAFGGINTSLIFTDPRINE